MTAWAAMLAGCGGGGGGTANLDAVVPGQFQAIVSSQSFQNVYAVGVTQQGVALFSDQSNNYYSFSELNGLVPVTSGLGTLLAELDDPNAPTLRTVYGSGNAKYYVGDSLVDALDENSNPIPGDVVGFDGDDPIVRKSGYTYYSKNRSWPTFATHAGSPAPRPAVAVFGRGMYFGTVQYPTTTGFGFGFYTSVAAWDANGRLTEMGRWDGNQAESTLSRVMDDGRVLGQVAGTLGRATVLWSLSGETEVLWQSDWAGHMTGSQSNGLLVGDDPTITGRGFIYTKATGRVPLVSRTSGLPAVTNGENFWPLAVSRNGWVFGYVYDSSMSPGHNRPALLKPNG